MSGKMYVVNGIGKENGQENCSSDKANGDPNYSNLNRPRAKGRPTGQGPVVGLLYVRSVLGILFMDVVYLSLGPHIHLVESMVS